MTSVQAQSSFDTQSGKLEAQGDIGRSVKDFLDYLKVEAGLAKNTILAYGRDLKSFMAYCTSQRISRLKQIKPALIQNICNCSAGPKRAKARLSDILPL